jgi:hypothetical protein
MFLISSSFPSHAIFGLGKCEKMRKSISAEESIRRTLSIEYKKQFQIDFYTLNNTDISSSTYRLIRDSDLKILQIANANQACFKSGELAYIRGEIQFAKTEIQYMNRGVAGGSVEQMILRSKYVPLLVEISGKRAPKIHR